MTYLRLAESFKTMNRSDRNALWRLTQDSLEVSGESSGKIFWSISTYLSLVTVTVLPAKEIIKSIPAKILQSVIGEFSRPIRNCIVARGRLFEKFTDV